MLIQAFPTADPTARQRGLDRAAVALRRGQLVAAPLDGGYAVVCDAFSRPGVARLRALRGRPDLVPQVLVGSAATVPGIARLPHAAPDLLRWCWPGPLTVLVAAQPSLDWDVADPSGAIAVRMPLHPVALELLAATGPLAAVPAGRPGQGPITDDQQVRTTIGDALAVCLCAGHLLASGPSAVVDLVADPPRLVRLGPWRAADLLDVCPNLVIPGESPSAG